jgi:hypothetical protein
LADGCVVNVLTRDHVAFRAGTRLLFAWDSEGKPHFLDAALITGLTGLGPA